MIYFNTLTISALLPRQPQPEPLRIAWQHLLDDYEHHIANMVLLSRKQQDLPTDRQNLIDGLKAFFSLLPTNNYDQLRVELPVYGAMQLYFTSLVIEQGIPRDCGEWSLKDFIAYIQHRIESEGTDTLEGQFPFEQHVIDCDACTARFALYQKLNIQEPTVFEHGLINSTINCAEWQQQRKVIIEQNCERILDIERRAILDNLPTQTAPSARLVSPRSWQRYIAIAASVMLCISILAVYLYPRREYKVKILPAHLQRDSRLLTISQDNYGISQEQREYHQRLNDALQDPNNEVSQAIIKEWRERVGLDRDSTRPVPIAPLMSEAERAHLLEQSQALYDAAQRLANSPAYEKGIGNLKEAVRLAKLAGVESAAVRPLVILSNIAMVKREYGQAIDYSYQLLECTNQEVDRSRIGSGLQTIGRAAYTLGWRDIALYTLDECLKVDELSLHRKPLAHCYKAVIYADCGEIVRAEQEIAQATEALNEKDNIYLTSKTYVLAYKARVKHISGHYNEALSLYNEMVKTGIRAGIHSQLLQGQANKGMGEVLLALNRCKEAKKKLINASEIYDLEQYKDDLFTIAASTTSCRDLIKRIDDSECALN